MFGKDWNTRWAATIAYLNKPFLMSRVGDHVNQVVPQGSRKAISAELSLGARPDGEDDPPYGTDPEQRHALRALLLCQKVYFSQHSGPKAGLIRLLMTNSHPAGKI